MLGYAVTVRIRPGAVPGTEPPAPGGPAGTLWDFMALLPPELPKIIVVEVSCSSTCCSLYLIVCVRT